MNRELREYVTRVGFSISLSKAQIAHLVFMHAAGEAHTRWSKSPSFLTTNAALQRRGLVEQMPEGPRLSKAGELVIELLQESGVYDDIMGDLVVWRGGGEFVALTEMLDRKAAS